MIKTSVIDEKAYQWHCNPDLQQTQRLGQYLMNQLCPTEKNPDIFYQKDNGKAWKDFVWQYGDKVRE